MSSAISSTFLSELKERRQMVAKLNSPPATKPDDSTSCDSEFVYNIGSVNTPKPGVRVVEQTLKGNYFETSIDLADSFHFLNALRNRRLMAAKPTEVSTSSESKKTSSDSKMSFVFNIGAMNTPETGVRVIEKDLEDNSFEVSIDSEDSPVPKEESQQIFRRCG